MNDKKAVETSLATIREFLSAEGFRPTEEDGVLYVQYQSWTVIVGMDSDDNQYFYAQTLFFWEIESESERIAALGAASDVSRRFKVAKVFMVDDGTDMGAQSGLFAISADAFCAVLVRVLDNVVTATEEFRRLMQAWTARRKEDEKTLPKE